MFNTWFQKLNLYFFSLYLFHHNSFCIVSPNLQPIHKIIFLSRWQNPKPHKEDIKWSGTAASPMLSQKCALNKYQLDWLTDIVLGICLSFHPTVLKGHALNVSHSNDLCFCPLSHKIQVTESAFNTLSRILQELIRSCLWFILRFSEKNHTNHRRPCDWEVFMCTMDCSSSQE